MAITEKEFQVPVGSHTDEDFAKLEAENDALRRAIALKDDYIERLEKGANNGRQSEG